MSDDFRSEGLIVFRSSKKKKCANCSRGTYLVFQSSSYKWRRCSRCWTPEEAKAIVKW